jgi:DNA-binding NarL/FixJ family response regulator
MALGIRVPISNHLRHCFESLSPRQRDVALLLCDGSTNMDIAQRLGVSIHTVKAHRAEIMRRMAVDSFAELINHLQYFCSKEGESEAHPGPLRIIVVEDDQWYREYLTDSLNALAFIATGVADSAAFKAAWAKQSADIVVLDIELGSGQEDGLAIATDLRTNSRCGIVMVTARGEMDDRLAGLGIGADAYFSKPVNIHELAFTLNNLGRRLG